MSRIPLPLAAGLVLALCLVAAPVKARQAAAPFVVDMTCFPEPPEEGEDFGIGPPPPCLLPDGIAGDFISPAPAGTATFVAKDDGTTLVKIDLDGLAPGLVITAWVSYYFPPGPTPDPIFDPIGDGLPPVAGVSAPLAPTTAPFSEGLGREPNLFTYIDEDAATLRVRLDWNPLAAGEGTLRNDMLFTHQADAPDGSGAEQPLCCPEGFPAPSSQPVGSSLLRVFDPATGYQLLDADGRPELLRSPVPVAFLAIVIHHDRQTHGINPGIPVLPMPGLSADTGDHFLLGMFDLRAFHEVAPEARVMADPARTPDGVVFSDVYPNPFNPQARFTLTLSEAQPVRVEVFDVLGRSVGLLHDGPLGARQPYRFTFDGGHLASGRYLIRATGRAFVATQAVTLLK